jgi:hypothetical protein
MSRLRVDRAEVAPYSDATMWRRTFAVALIVLALVPCSAPFATCALDDVAPLFGATSDPDRVVVAPPSIATPSGVVLQKRHGLERPAADHTLDLAASAAPS